MKLRTKCITWAPQACLNISFQQIMFTYILERAHTNTIQLATGPKEERPRACMQVVTPPAARPELDDRLRSAPLDVDLQDAVHDAEDDEADQDPRQGVHLQTHGWIWMVDPGGRN